MKYQAKLFLVLLLALSICRAVPMLRKQTNLQQHLTPGLNLKNRQIQILIQDAYDDYAEELAEDPFPEPPQDEKTEQSAYQQDLTSPVFIPPGNEKPQLTEDQTNLQNTSENEENPPSDDNYAQNEEDIQTDVEQDDQTSLESNQNVNEEEPDTLSSGTNISEEDQTKINNVFGGDTSLSKTDIDEANIQHEQNGLAVTTDLEQDKNKDEEEADTLLSGSNLALDAINDTIHGETDFSSESVGSGSNQDQSEAFSGDSTLSQQEVQASGIQQNQNGQEVESNIVQKTEEEQETALTGSSIVTNAINQIIDAQADDSQGSQSDQSPQGDNDQILSQEAPESQTQNLESNNAVDGDLSSGNQNEQDQQAFFSQTGLNDYQSEEEIQENESYLNGGAIAQHAADELQQKEQEIISFEEQKENSIFN